MSDMKPGYRITLRCGFTVESATSPTFELRTSERNVYDSSGDTYKDFGFRDASISVIWNRVASDSPCFFRCNMTELIDFANYSSKEATGMAGLENLGATCYLNALLQVDTLNVLLTCYSQHFLTLIFDSDALSCE